MKKKLLSILLSLSMVLTSASVNALPVFADETDGSTDITAVEEITADDEISLDNETSAGEEVSASQAESDVSIPFVEDEQQAIKIQEESEIEVQEEDKTSKPALASSDSNPWEEDFDGTVIELTTENPITVSPLSNQEPYWFSFVAEEDVTYSFYSSYDEDSGDEPDTYATLYDSEGNEIEDDDDSGQNWQFCISYELTAGETYYLQVKTFKSEDGYADYTVTVEELITPVEIQAIYNFPEHSPLYMYSELTSVSADILYSDGTVKNYSVYDVDPYGNDLSISTDDCNRNVEGTYPVEITFGELSTTLETHIVSWDELDVTYISLGDTSIDPDGEYTYAVFTAPSTGYYEFSAFSSASTQGGLYIYQEDLMPGHTESYPYAHQVTEAQIWDHGPLNVGVTLTQGNIYLFKLYTDGETNITVNAAKMKDVSSVTASISGTNYLYKKYDALTYSVHYTDGTEETATLTNVSIYGDYRTSGGSSLAISTNYSIYATGGDTSGINMAGPAEVTISCNGVKTIVPITVTPRVEGFYDKEVTMDGESATITIPAVEEYSNTTMDYYYDTYFVKITPSVTNRYEIIDADDSYSFVRIYDESDRMIHSKYSNYGICQKKPLLEAGKSYLLSIEQNHMDSIGIPEGTVTIQKAVIATGMTVKKAPSIITDSYDLVDSIEVEVTYDNGQTETLCPIQEEGMNYDSFSFELYKQEEEDGERVWDEIGYWFGNLSYHGSGTYKYIFTLDDCSVEYIFEYKDKTSISELSIIVPDVFNGYIDDIRVEAVYGEDDVREANIMEYENKYGTYLDWTLTNDTEGYDIDMDWVDAVGTEYLPAGTYSLEVSLDGVEADANFEVLTIDEAFPALEFGSNQLTPENETDMYSFVPEESGAYRFDNHNGFISIYDDSCNKLIYVNCSPGTGIANMEADKPYRVSIQYVDDEDECTIDISQTVEVPEFTVSINKPIYGGVQTVESTDITISYTDSEGNYYEYLANEVDPNGYNLNTFWILDEDDDSVDTLEPDETYELRYNLAGYESYFEFETETPSSDLPDLLDLSSVEVLPSTHEVFKIAAEEDLTFELNADNTFVRINIYNDDYDLVYENEYIFSSVSKTFDLSAGNYYIEILSRSNIAGSLKIKGRNKLAILEQPEYVTAGVKANVSFHVEAENATFYQWEYTKNGKTWYKSSAASATTDTLTVKVATTNYTNLYRCKVTGVDGSVMYTDLAGINFIPGVVITQQPQVVTTANAKDKVTFTVEAENVAEYQWYYSKNGGANWYPTSASGNKTNQITVTLSSTNMNNMYRCRMLGNDGNAVNSKRTGAIILKAQPQDQVYSSGKKVNFSVTAENIAEYQWQYSKNGGNSWYDSSATGSTTDTMTLTAKSTNKDNLYRCKLTATSGLVGYSAPAGFVEGYTGLTIISQPENASGSIGDAVSFSVEAVNAASYQWYYTKNGSSWYKSGATGNQTDTLSLKISSSNTAYQFKCKITGTDGTSVTTNVVGFTVVG